MVMVMGLVGFIGLFLVCCFLMCGIRVVGIDNYNDYYDFFFKEVRLVIIVNSDNY